jgi:hypothetical protein
MKNAGIQIRMVRFRKLLKIVSPYTGTTYTVSSENSLSFSCATQQVASHAYCGAAGPVSRMVSQQEKAFCVLRFEISRSVITVQREFHARFRKDTPHKNSTFLKPCTKPTLHYNYRSGHLQTKHTESLLLLRRNLGNWSAAPQ